MTGPAPRIHLSRASSSLSEDRLSEDQDVSSVGAATEAELWGELTPHHLMVLRQHFLQPRGWVGPRSSFSGPTGEEEPETRLLTRPQFIDAVTNLLDTSRYEGVCGAIFDAVLAASSSTSSSSSSSASPSAATSLCAIGAQISSSSSNISSSSGSSYGGSLSTVGVSWAGLVAYLAAGVGGGQRDAPPQPLFSPSPHYRLLTHNKREGVGGVVVSGRKRLIVFGSRGSITKTFLRPRQDLYGQLHLDSNPDEEQQTHTYARQKVSLGTWVVEVALVEEDMVVVAASSSTLHFVDASTSPLQEVVRVTNLPALPSCVAAGRDGENRWVAVGDDSGDIHLIRFPHPVSALLTRSRNEGLTSLTWQEMCSRLQELNGRMVEVCGRVRVVTLSGVHGASVKRVSFHPASSNLVSCSGDHKTSLVVRGPDHATKTYTFTVPKGVRVFAVEWSLHLVVTGSSDGQLRVWNPYVPEAPLSVLPAAPARAPPADILIWIPRKAIVTCDADAVVRIYGVEGGRCVQSVSLSFPGGSAGLSARPLTLLPSGHLIVSCRDYLASLNPASRPRSATSAAVDTLSQRDDCSEAESDEGGGDEDEGDFEEQKEPKTMEGEHTVLSGDESRERARIRRLVRQGAAFCCLQLYAAKPPKLPADLPLPPRLAALGLSPADPAMLLAHLPAANATTPTPRSTPGSARTPPASRRAPPTPRAASRPPSSRRIGRPKSSRPTSRLAPTPGTPGSGRHLSPGWRPQAKPRGR